MEINYKKDVNSLHIARLYQEIQPDRVFGGGLQEGRKS